MSLVHRADAFDAFQFNDNQVIDEEINTLAKVDSLAIVND